MRKPMKKYRLILDAQNVGYRSLKLRSNATTQQEDAKPRSYLQFKHALRATTGYTKTEKMPNPLDSCGQEETAKSLPLMTQENLF